MRGPPDPDAAPDVATGAARRRLGALKAVNIPRQAMSMIGLIIGFGLYALAGRLQAPWNSVLVGGMFAALGVSTFLYARGERWIQALGLVLAVYGLLRALVLH